MKEADEKKYDSLTLSRSSPVEVKCKDGEWRFGKVLMSNPHRVRIRVLNFTTSECEGAVIVDKEQFKLKLRSPVYDKVGVEKLLQLPLTPVAIQLYNRYDFNQILPGIFLGSSAASRKRVFEKCGIKGVLSLIAYREDHKFPSGVEYKILPTEDNKNQDLAKHFDDTFNFIDMITSSKNSGILIHCLVGVSRSTTILLAYLIRKYRLPLKDAYILVSNRRGVIAPNEGFMKQLVLFDQACRKNELT